MTQVCMRDKTGTKVCLVVDFDKYLFDFDICIDIYVYKYYQVLQTI